jgi:leader peptidase (prepilin peptidase)/N-methyltransferase
MIIIAIIDYRQQIIPNKLILVGTIMGTVLNLAVGKLSLLEMIIGLASGGTVLLVIAVISNGGIGGGDVKLAAML